MAKLSQDTIKWILSLDATQAQEEIHKLNKNNDELRKNAKAAREAMAKLDPKSQEWANANKNLNSYNRQIADNNAKIKALSKQTNDQVKTLAELRKELKQAQREFANTSKALQPERYRELQTRIRELKDRIHEATGETDKMSSAWKAVGKLKAVVTGTFNAIGYAITDMVIGGIKNAVKTIEEFGAANSRLAAILGESRGGIRQLTEQAKELGRTTTATASQVTGLQVELAKLGFTQQQIISMTPGVLKFAKSVGTDLSSASALAGATLRIFNKDASQTEDVLATLAISTNRSALDFSKLEASMATIGPVANAYGMSVEDTVAMLGALANAGFDASSAATATRNILLNLSDASGDLAKALGGPATNLDEIVAGFKKLNDQGIDLATSLELTDKRSVAAFSSFLQGADSMIELRDSISNCNEEFNQMKATMGDNATAAKAGLESAIEGLMLKFEEGEGVLADLYKFVTLLVSGFSNLLDMLAPVGSAFMWVVDIIKSCFEYVGKLVKGMVSFIGGMKTVQAIITGVTATWAAFKAVMVASTLAAKGFMVSIKESTIVLKAHDVWLKIVKTSQTLWNNAIKANPIAAAISLVVGLTAAIATLVKKTGESSSAINKLSEDEMHEQKIQEKQAEAVAETTARIKTLTAVAENEKASLQERKKACEELNKIIPDYNAHIDETTGKYVAAKDALDKYIESLQKSARLEYYNDMMRDASMELEKQRVNLKKAAEDFEKYKFRDQMDADRIFAERQLNQIQSIYDIAESKARHVQSLIDDASSKGLISLGTTTNPSGTSHGSDNSDTSDDSKAKREREKAKREQEKAEREAEKARKEAVKSMELHHSQRLSILENANEAEHRAMQKAVADNVTTREAADVYMLARDRDYHQQRLEELQSYLQAVDNSEQLTADERIAIEMRVSKEISAIQRQLLTDTGNWAQMMRELTQDSSSMKGMRDGYDERKLATARLYDAMITAARNAGEDTTALEQAKYSRLADIDEEYRQKMFELAQITGVTWEDEYDNELARLKDLHRKGIIDEKQFQKARIQLQIANAKKYFDLYAGMAGNAVSAMQDAEIAASDAKYDVLIQQAKNNGEDTTALEEEKENKKLEIQKKYADVNFAIKVSEIIANTAVSIMKAYSELGPIGGAVAAAMLTATGIAQVAMANAERQKVKNMQPSSSSSSSSSLSSAAKKVNPNGYAEGGYTGDGDRYEIAGIVHKGEYVVPKPIMSNPAVMDAVGLIEAVRLDKMHLNGTAAPKGFADGGPTTPGSTLTVNTADNAQLVAAISDLRKATEHIRNIRAYLVYRDLEEKKAEIERARKPFTRNLK